MNANRTTVSASGGVGVLGLLGVAFVVLRLCGVVSWGWNIVLAPFWVPALFAVVFLVTLLAVFAAMEWDRRRHREMHR